MGKGIKEVIRTMIADNMSDESIKAVINRYKKGQQEAKNNAAIKAVAAQKIKEEGVDDPDAYHAGGEWSRINRKTGEVVSNVDINSADLEAGDYEYNDLTDRFNDDDSHKLANFIFDGEDRSGFDLTYNKDSVTAEKEKGKKEETFNEEKYNAIQNVENNGGEWNEQNEQAWLRENYPEKAKVLASDVAAAVSDDGRASRSFRKSESGTINQLKKAFGKGSDYYNKTGLQFDFSYGFTGGSSSLSIDDDYIIIKAPDGIKKTFQTDLDGDKAKEQFQNFKKWAAEHSDPEGEVRTNSGETYTTGELVLMDEEKFVKELTNSGLVVQEAETPGDAVIVELPGQGPNGGTKYISVDLQPNTHKGEIKARQQMAEILKYQSKVKENGNQQVMDVLDTNDNDDFYSPGDFGEMSDKTIATLQAAGIKATPTGGTVAVDKKNFWSIDAENDAIEYKWKDPNGSVFTGSIYDYKNHVANGKVSLSVEQKDMLLTQVEVNAASYKKEVDKKAKEEIEKQTPWSSYNSYYTDKMPEDFGAGLVMEGVDGEEIALMDPMGIMVNSFEDYFDVEDDEKQAKVKNFDPEEFLAFHYEKYGTSKGGKEEFIRENLPFVENAWGSIYKEATYDDEGKVTSKGLDNNLAQHRAKINADIYKSSLRKVMESEEGLQNYIRVSRLMSRSDIEEKEKNISKITQNYTKKLETEKFVSQQELNNIVKNGSKEGVTNIEYYQHGDTPGYYVVTAKDEKVRQKYQNKIDNSIKRNNIRSAEYELERLNLVEEWKGVDIARAGHEEDAPITKAASMDFSLVSTLATDVTHSFENMALDIPIFFGSESALTKKQQNLDYAEQYLPEMGTYDDGKGGVGTYFLRTVAQQSAPIITAIVGSFGATAAFGAVRGATIAKNVIPAFYGLTAAGGKRGELMTAENKAEQAMLDLKEIRKNESKIDPQVFKQIVSELEQTVAAGKLDPLNYWTTVIGTGVIEGTVTKFLGKVPNALKMVDDFVSPFDDIVKAGWRNGIQNAVSAGGRMSYRVGSEMAEELLIAGGTMGLEVMTLGNEFEWDTLDDVAVQAMMVAGPMNGTGVAYSSVLQHYATRSMYGKNKAIKDELKSINAEFGKLDPKAAGYKRRKKDLAEQMIEQTKKLDGLTSEMELMAMANGGKNTGDLMRIGNELNELHTKAGVDPTSSPDSQKKQVAVYVSSIKDSKEQKKFNDQYNNALKAKEKNLSKIDFDNVIEQVYGEEGKRIKKKLLKANPSLKSLDSKEMAAAIHSEFKRQIRQNKAQVTRKAYDGKILEFVEKAVYGGKTFKESGRKNRKRKAEDELLTQYGDQLGIQSNNSNIILNKDQSIKAASVLSDKRLQDIEAVEAGTDQELQITLLNFQDDIKQKAFDKIDANKSLSEDQRTEEKAAFEAIIDEESEQLLEELRMGETNAVILSNGKYIVKDKKAADQQLKDGNLLAGTALSHEISHAIDQKVFDGVGEMVNYSNNLMDYMKENVPEVHRNAINLQRSIGNVSVNPDGSFSFPTNPDGGSRESIFREEYTKSVQDFMSRNKYASERRQILNEGQSMGNKFYAMFRGDYKINTPQDAAFYMASYLDSFKKGELGDLQKRKIDALEKTEKKRALGKTKKSANIKSPILYDQANNTGKKANDLFANKDSNPDYAFDIAKLFEPMLGKYLRRIEDKGAILGKQDEYGDISSDERQKNITDYTMNGMYGKRGIVDLIDKFNPDEMIDVVDPKTGETVQEANTISKWLNGAFPQRLSEFTENTTIDFQGFKVDIDKAANVFTTETEDAVNNILTNEVQEQLNTPFLDNVELTDNQVIEVREAISSIVGRKLPALDQVISKNKSVSALVSALKKEFGVKNGPLHRLIQDIIGGNKIDVENYFRSPRNKRAMLQTLTTTWLAKNLPMAVQKKVVGVGYTTDHLGRKKGKKAGDIEAWLSSEDGPYKGMTDGKQKIRRNPKANNDVTPAMLLSNFVKGGTMTDIRRAGLEKLELALAQEFGLEVFKADMINDGDLKDLFVGRQDLFDRVLADNYVEEFVRQTERGVTKRSTNPIDFIPIEDQNALEVIQAEAYALVDNLIKNFDKNKPYGGIEAQLDQFPQETIEYFEEMGIFDMFDTDVKNGFVIPTKNMDWGMFDKAKQVYLNNGTQSKVMKDAMAANSLAMINSFPPQVLKGLTKEFFGLVSSRLLDGAIKSDGSTGPYIDLRRQFEEAQNKPNNNVKLPFDPSKLELLNSSSGLMKSISNILNENILEVDKKVKLKKLQPRIDAANANNKAFLKWFFGESAKMLVKNPENAAGLAALLQGATNNVKGFRAFTDLGMIKLLDNSQAPFVKPDGSFTTTKPNDTNGHVINIKHPDYKRAMQEANNNEKVAGEILGYKGEHIDPSANVMQGLFNSTLELASMLQQNPTKQNKILREHSAKFDDILLNFDQSLGTKVDSDIQDKKLTSTSRAGYARNLAIPLEGYVDAKTGLPVENLIKEKTINSFQMAGLQARLNAERVSDAIVVSRRSQNPSKGITILDFDDTLATSNSQVISTSPDGVVRNLTAEQFANEGADLLDQGWTHDFSEFNKVVEGKVARLFQKALKLQGKFGPENMFVLTARPSQSARSIFDFLSANGLNIPIKNITGLGNSTAEAKALWVADKVTEGYNDFYFADDAMQNVTAVKNMLDQFDVKSKVQQAKRSANPSVDFNNILEQTTKVESEKVFSEAQAKIRGHKSKYKSIIPASAQDFAGLLYNFLGKGKLGETQMKFFKDKLIDPFARAINELNSSKQNSAENYSVLLKQSPAVKSVLGVKVEGTDFNYDQAIRVYLWNKAGFDIPGLSQRDLNALNSVVENDPNLKSFAEALGVMSGKDAGYSEPGDFWLAENIKSDLLSDGSIGDARGDFLAEWKENKDLIFSKENLNKIEAIYGSKFREALQDVLYRMETGKNRPAGGGRLVNIYTNWVNNSVGAIMFLNMRSAILQTISATNYINWSDNNPLKAGAAFANQPQFWKDFSMLFNSDYLKQRRSGNQRGINEAELSAAVAGSENKAKAVIAWLLKKGFLPTQIADSFAIASGGASFYRNRVNKYVKEGMSQVEAEKQAFLDFQEVTEVSQQSARPDMISQQQASPLGKLILAFQNTPMQYARIMNKASRDLANGRGDGKTHISKILYYGVVQSIIFGALQSALFASLGDDDEEKFDNKTDRILNGMIDSVLSGIGYGGKAVSTVKNTIREFLKQKEKGFNSDHTYTILQILGFSPPIGSKLRKIYSSIQTDEFNEGVYSKRGFTLDNPIWSVIGNVVEGVTNIPLGRLSNKMKNIDNALDDSNEWWKRVALVMGWNTWDLGIKDKDIEAVKTEIKEEKKVESKKKAKVKKEKKKKEKQEENKTVIEENKKKSKKDGICSAISKGGNRCKTKVVEGKAFCTVHEKTEQRTDGIKTQCKKIKNGDKRCKMQTANKSGLCYYHD